ncbi:uncharacterized protein LOC142982166 [Anticarsia gemmatalis]|uniref:uncharacterized protein LOC142982166 n=1 Tax=Anticarsia gemmatalis TaxID=129554 RepID=UPI003F77186E
MAKKKIKNKGKQVTKTVTSFDEISNEVIAAAYSAATPPLMPVFLKVCRLCESKDGPFLNIFDSEKVIAKKIDELMPFSVTENDDLPHKICFRCSAKLEELFEFIQKCIKTQESLRNAIGKTGTFVPKAKMAKKLWEEKLNKTNMSNDDICDALIKKAMEGIKAIPTSPDLEDETVPEVKKVTMNKELLALQRDFKVEPKSEDFDELKPRQSRLSHEKNVSKVTRSRPDIVSKKAESTKPDNDATLKTHEEAAEAEASKSKTNNGKKVSGTKTQNINQLSFDYDDPAPTANQESESEEEKIEEPKKPFNIMDHISMIKVNGVGTLFQCKLCNRNFLKKEVVESHNCAKNGGPKLDLPKTIPAPEPPRVPTVKYIKIDSDMKKSLTEKVKKSESEKLASSEAQEENYEPPPKIKPRPKIGPASKTRRFQDSDSNKSQAPAEAPSIDPPVAATPSVHFPSLPNLNGRFKLVPGPNNMFTLVEDNSAAQAAVSSQLPPTESKKSSKKRKSDEIVSNVGASNSRSLLKPPSPDVIDVDDQSQPYPVGLFQTAHNSRLYEPPVPEAPVTFTTPAMKKQSYTIVQTGNPSKLLISTKAKAVDVEVPKKRPRKSKNEAREDPDMKEPYTVTLEDVAPPKDTGFFTFINVDPLLQPSYVLPTDNIIQESQISTSSSVLPRPSESKEKDKEKYPCNMCGENFSREKKLLAHIQSHYMKMDEEDLTRSKKISKKSSRK